MRLVPAALLVLVGIGAVLFMRHRDDRPVSMSQAQGGVPVVFNLSLPDARSVSVIGTFNQWKAKGYEMQWDNERKGWSLTLTLPMGRHEYSFLVDGQMILPDPRALLSQEDGFGNRNAVLILGNGNGKNI